jgi:hypothetical protein
MIEEIDILGVYVPAALVWGVLSATLVYLVRTPLQRVPIYRVLWHPGLFEFACFILIWWGLSAFADTFLYSWLVS